MNAPTTITSRDNPLLKRLRVLAQDNAAYRKQGQVWLEGDHLCRALLARGHRPVTAVFSETFWRQAPHDLRDAADHIVTVPDALMAGISGLESPAGVGFVWDLPQAAVLQSGAAAVVLDRLQDAGNVGSILRSAAAMGFAQVLALKGTAALWSPKVLRAGMGAHFGLHLVEGLSVDDLAGLSVPLLVTSSHQGDFLHQARLPWPCAWVLGHEGQGVSPALEALATQKVRIAQPGGEESLNVAAAAAICLHASAAGR
ncbi:MAG TPA: rRNA methyltransferase [Hydrogenophaga sp.]|jgi:TrmH family RNA methyltransferase|uniref:TrmH family RNA methyltransferase n=1 Tax=Hydrogenophaga sp. TaxID=1904254 RepID=UPI0008B3BD78|nr:RNA methyltransferase [Hydrogenophaga sp.]MBU4180529.1 RNA methyltransferase [Gammaproteobacteria bacterium]OGA78642.1 MAG: rRNA methyltransferase [Burkholderiales bacterium GWE1_65_30]OGA89215.1 MAG: rRNA methyltransferase [Burkholderiales bacterium GWF1_66_17]OGB34496.1 MAG: rRNA methyltransferase [Burkholderiales bacterium RIFCSPLOWO2_02_FULL_66_35]OGB38257.1 MAG: rRNA methyltransferase [Burkholderiales bacterium RIFCSPHIGHO2_02_FULL_66_10]